MGQWIQAQTWHEIYTLHCVNKKVELFEKMMMEKIDSFFPMKTIRVNENTKPWMNNQSIQLDRKRKREYLKHKKSAKWKKLNSDFEELSNQLKESYYETMVQDLKTSNPSQWYSKVKRMSTINQTKDEEIIVEQIKNETSQKQAEIIADQFASISNLYQPLKTEDIDIPSDVNSEPVPLFEPKKASTHSTW